MSIVVGTNIRYPCGHEEEKCNCEDSTEYWRIKRQEQEKSQNDKGGETTWRS